MRASGGLGAAARRAVAGAARLLAAASAVAVLTAGFALRPAAGDAAPVRGRLPRAPLQPGGELAPFPEIPEDASVEETLAILKDRLERVHRVFRAGGGPR